MFNIKQWFIKNSSQGIIVFPIFIICTFPMVIGSSLIPNKTQYYIPKNTPLQKTARYRSDALLFKDNDTTYYFNCNLWFEYHFCQNITSDLMVKNATYQIISCKYQECSAIIHQGIFIHKENQEIHYQATPNFIDDAVNYQININRIVLAIFVICVLGFLMSVAVVFGNKPKERK